MYQPGEKVHHPVIVSLHGLDYCQTVVGKLVAARIKACGKCGVA
jgi:hypothetical protein